MLLLVSVSVSNICECCTTLEDTLTETSSSMVVTSAAVNTSKNFPKTRWVREIGLLRMVSMVPRSFSPAVKSMAGDIAPCRHIRISMYEIMPPNKAAATFSGGAMLCRFTSNGFSRSPGRWFASRRLTVIPSRYSFK